MKDTLISFETAKLAREKGFNIPTISYYNPKGRSEESEGYMTERLECSNWNNGQGSYPTHAKDVECSAPTQSLLQRWLREVHKIHIEVRTNHKWNVNIITLRNISGEIKSMDSELHKWNIKTYEEALEIGLQEGLKLIR